MIYFLFCVLGLFICEKLSAEEFHAESLPHGSDVTVPGNTQTLVDLSTRVFLSATENVQTIRFSPIALHGKIPTSIDLAIFDSNQTRVKYIKVSPATPFLYSFKKMASIAVIPQKIINSSLSSSIPTQINTDSQTVLAVESDKALKISR